MIGDGLKADRVAPRTILGRTAKKATRRTQSQRRESVVASWMTQYGPELPHGTQMLRNKDKNVIDCVDNLDGVS